jgi:hypothetical protein
MPSRRVPPRAGGTLRVNSGDLMSADICAGPYDAVIERRSVQLFAEEERPIALERLVSRLSEPGMLVSHKHDGQWKPGSDRRHYAGA